MDGSNNEKNLTSSKQNGSQSPEHEVSTSSKITPHSKSDGDKHLQKSCSICLKTMRSDNLKRHIKTHNVTKSKVFMISCTICEKVMRKNHLKRHLKTHSKPFNLTRDLVNNDTPSLSYAEEIVNQRGKECQQIFNEKLKTGSLVKKMLSETDIVPFCLTKDLKEPLELHEQYINSEINNCTLKSWQKELLTFMENPSDREIIWIIGKRGNEGKTWFQKYSEQYFGIRRVFRTSIVKEASSLLHMLSKKTLACTDIFLLNISRSYDIADVPYTVLEDIKDGQATSSKYNSKILKLCTPNVLVVFSNYSPMYTKVSKDRWRIYTIDETNDKLISNTYDQRALLPQERNQFRKNIRASKQD